MLLFLILAIIVTILLVFTVLAVSAGGAVFIMIFADVIVCIMIILWIMKRILRKKR